MVPIDYLAVLIATALNCIIGFVWYGSFFDKRWKRLVGITQEDATAIMEKNGIWTWIGMVAQAFFMMFIFAHTIVFVTTYTGTYGVAGGMATAFWTWLGFYATTALSPVLWQGRKIELWFIDAGYYLVVLMAAGVVMGLMQ